MAENKISRKYFLWMDLEMTGLFPETDTILEIAAIVTNKHLDIVDTAPEFIIKHDSKAFSLMDKWNQKHHSKSGLWEKAIQSSTGIADAEGELLNFLGTYFSMKEKAILAGNSIWHDRRFIIKYMPRLDAFLHYRMIDVSSLKLLSQSWYPKVKLPKKQDAHRAMDDIRESIEELRFFRQTIFKQYSEEA